MDRSIKKSITINEFSYILNLNKVTESERSRLVPVLFENPTAKKVFLLKENLKTLDELTKTIKTVITNTDAVESIKGIFYVNDDLYIPPEIKRIFFDNTRVSFFVGAGVSKLLKIPLWEELADSAIECLRDNQYINYSEWSKLKSDKSSAKQKLSIFHKVVGNDSDLEKFYKEKLQAKPNEIDNPYELLCSLEQAMNKTVLKISTNIDQEWEKVLEEKYAKEKTTIDEEGRNIDEFASYESTQFSDFSRDQKISEKILYQIHGSLKLFESTIITTAAYVDNYRDEKKLKGFLEEIFKNYCVIFIGSSIQEFEIIEHCLKKSPNQHYALVGTYIGDENLFRVKEKYFAELQVKAIPYYLDFQGYDRLLFLLKRWCQEIKSSRKKDFYDGLKLIDEVL